MGHSLTLLTAALLVGQGPVFELTGNRNCACKNGQQGRVQAQPEIITENRTVGWWNWRNSTTTTANESWSSADGVQQASWVDNRPVLSKIRSWFGRGDSSSAPRTEIVQPATNQPIIVQPSNTSEYNYRRLPTTSEPPLTAPANAQPKIINAPAAPIKPAAPATQKPGKVAPPPAGPLTIDIEPIEFRPAGTAKGLTPAAATTPAPIAAPPSRPNPISARFVNKVGQPGDYSWVTGQLEVRNGVYVIHYATPETVDQYHGSLVLAADAKLLANVRSGDLVSVHGSVVQQGAGRVAYRVQTIDLIER